MTRPTPERIDNTRMITFITPLRRFGIIWLRFVFALTRRFPGLTKIAPMKVVHCTHWSVLTSIPYNGPPQLREKPSRRMLVWGSVFNGEMDPYIEAFVASVRHQIWATWGTSIGYPGTRSVGRLRDYIVAASWPGSHAYSAYPGATVRMIDSAMTITKEHEFLRAAARTETPEQFAVTYDGFLRRCQQDL